MEHIVVKVPTARAFRPVLRLVVGGVGSRCGLPFDRVDELQAAIGAVLDQRVAAGATIELEAAIGEAELVVALGPFVVADDRAGRRVTAVLVDRVGTVDRDGLEWVELAVAMPIATRAGA
ncbi:MAG: hypothetical protein ABI927_01150 [Gaiellaceae bacterium]